MSKKLGKKHEHDGLRQVAALPWRMGNGRAEVCLITTRETSRWTIPKGWPMKGREDWEAARIEAEQEAGITGEVDEAPIGKFLYWKRQLDHFDLIEVIVYLLRVTANLPAWKEQGQRQVRWVPPGDGSVVVEEPALASLLKTVDKQLGS